MSKRNVVFNKPDEPLFLKKLKQQIGYCEGPTVETKREKLPYLYNDDDHENLDDQPTVVVLKPGDLTAEEVDAVKQKEKTEKESAPADLSQKIVFRPTKKKEEKEASADVRKSTPVFEQSKNTKRERESSTKLSFYEDEDEEEDENDH